jgi:adenylyltransferase/sulfurtransferase
MAVPADSVREVDVARARQLLAGEERPVLVDVRQQAEWNQGHLEDATLLPMAELEARIGEIAPDRERPVLLYCRSGARSHRAAAILLALGYAEPINVAGGILDWEAAGYPTIVPSSMDPDRLRRYSRHLLIPEIGEKGQTRLLETRMLLIGAGGLGSPAALYLAAAGVGTLGIVDADVVDDSNLQRQVLHDNAALGRPKVDSARERIAGLNTDVEVLAFEERLTSENIDRILGQGWDVIVDGADNFPTRYLVNDASVWKGIPVVHGSIYRFEGQVTVFRPYEGPCYRCLFPQPPPPELAPSCAEGGVLGVLPGVVGSLQANEALKLALGIGDPLVGRLLLYDALEATFTEVTLRRDPDCPVCGANPTITEYIDYVEFCAGVAA